MARSSDIFTTIHSEGALLPPDLLKRIAEGDGGLEGLAPGDYHLSGERLNEAINRAWNRIQGAWAAFEAARERLPEGDLGTSITRERWLLPLFDALSYGRLPTARAVEIDGKSYPVSHRWANVPIHLVSYQLDLDRRAPGVAGAAAMSPHSLLQVYLNRSDDVLWGFLSNGLQLRILRDNVSLTRQAYVDFDLEAMMEGEVYADFVLLYLLCHQSRVEAERPVDFWLEAWMKAAQEQGTRALDQLREGVEQAIERLGAGFIAHSANHELRQALQTGALGTQDYYRQLLRLVYRLLFLFTAEDRDLLHPKAIDDQTRQRYHDYYSTRRLREMAGRIKGTRHHDLFEGLRLVTRLLSGEEPYTEEHRAALGLPALNGWLFREEAVGDIIDCQIANRDLLDAVRALAYTEDRAARVLRAVDYKNLGPEELGSVYESLLELHPDIHIEARTFELGSAAGHERKTTGSYYTPDSLVQALLDSA
ncbi:MAG: type II DNA modification enzyme, partial [Anaerolineae bacterium]|nr:type II DNA modification enzyme [Anaerolineae bacterium]